MQEWWQKYYCLSIGCAGRNRAHSSWVVSALNARNRGVLFWRGNRRGHGGPCGTSIQRAEEVPRPPAHRETGAAPILLLANADDVNFRAAFCRALGDGQRRCGHAGSRSEEHTSELQSPCNL